MGDVDSGKIWNAVIINLRFLLPKCKVSVSACNLKTKENINENRPLIHFYSLLWTWWTENKTYKWVSFCSQMIEILSYNNLHENERISIVFIQAV